MPSHPTSLLIALRVGFWALGLAGLPAKVSRLRYHHLGATLPELRGASGYRRLASGSAPESSRRRRSPYAGTPLPAVRRLGRRTRSTIHPCRHWHRGLRQRPGTTGLNHAHSYSVARIVTSPQRRVRRFQVEWVNSDASPRVGCLDRAYGRPKACLTEPYPVLITTKKRRTARCPNARDDRT